MIRGTVGDDGSDENKAAGGEGSSGEVGTLLTGEETGENSRTNSVLTARAAGTSIVY